jgi:glycolate oxidase iron-sulfur subunit
MFDFMDMDFNGSLTELPPATGPYIPEASDCMRCGMCVSHCPTYRIFQIDEETPRRRIRTLEKLLVAEQSISADEQTHLLNCLQCRACETACPSHMAYGQLFDQALVKLHRQFNRLATVAFWLIEHKAWRIRLMPLLSLYQSLGLQKLLRQSGLLQKLQLAKVDALLTPPALVNLAENYLCAEPKRGTVALFTGCIAEQFDRDTLVASIRVLNTIGYEVLVPAQQRCCGAIHQHNGLSAQGFIDNNVGLFNSLNVDAVLFTASGCGAMLTEYQLDDKTAEQQFQTRLQDLNTFLLAHWPEDLNLTPLTERVVVHEPCSQRHVLKNVQSQYQLLEKIPGLEIIPLADNHVCCGAGGSYLLSHPENAEQLLKLKLQTIHDTPSEWLISSNFGCATFLSTAKRRVVHPVVVLAQSLVDS